jgi:hypothetical protein
MRAFTLAGAILGATLCAAPAGAQSQCVPKLLARVQMVREAGSSRFLVPVSINGVEKKMMLHLGGLDAYIERSAAEELHLPLRQGNFMIYDNRGNVSKDIASVATLMLGQVRLRDVSMIVQPDPDAGPDAENAGTLGAGILAGQDIDIDLGSGLLTLFSHDHCPDRLGYWESAPPDSARFNPDGTIMLPATLDGRSMKAYLMTASLDTTMRLDVARRHFGLSGESPGMESLKPADPLATLGMPPLEDKNGAPPAVYMYTFQSLSFAGVTVKKPRVRIYESTMSRYGDTSQQTANRALRNNDGLQRPDEIMLGMNLLRHLHIYLATHEKRIYVSGAFTVPGAAAPAR